MRPDLDSKRVSSCNEALMQDNSPLVLLSQQITVARVANVSIIDNLFLSPPLTPRTYSFPTGVDLVCSIDIDRSRKSIICSRCCFFLSTSETAKAGVLSDVANSTVWPTVMCG
jgi:hypothetical protein